MLVGFATGTTNISLLHCRHFSSYLRAGRKWGVSGWAANSLKWLSNIALARRELGLLNLCC